jgi:hypothetical protein
MSTDSDIALITQGRTYVRIAAAALVLTSVLTVLAYAVRLGTHQLPQQVVRIALTAGLGYALTRGQRWARWVTVLLLLAGMFVVVPVFADPLAFSREKLAGTLIVLAMFVTYGLIGRGLLYSTSVRAFFRAHRDGIGSAAASPNE